MHPYVKMDRIESTGNKLIDMIYAGMSLMFMLFGWLSAQNAQTVLQYIATVVSIAAGCMVFYNNYKQSKKHK